MTQTLRTILIIAAFTLLTIWLFQTPHARSCREQYENSVTTHNVEPTDDVHSYGVRFLPYLKKSNETLTDIDYDAFRVYDHTDKQRDERSYKYSCAVEQERPVKYKDNGQDIRNVTPNTSLQKACMKGDRITDSNDINGVCSKTSLLTNDSNAYTNEINENLPKMDMTRDEHHSLVAMRPRMKTYIEVDQTAGKFNTPVREQTLEYEELPDTVNRYRNDTLRTIRNGNERNIALRQKYPFYDGVQ
jgi:hypothetical protein